MFDSAWPGSDRSATLHMLRSGPIQLPHSPPGFQGGELTGKIGSGAEHNPTQALAEEELFAPGTSE